MKVLWICNIMLPMIAKALGRACSNKEGWLTGLLDALVKPGEHGKPGELGECSKPEIKLGVAFPVSWGEEMPKGSVGGVSYYGFRENTARPERYDPAMERDMQEILQDFQPDLLHCFGTEYPHTLAAVRAFGRPQRTLIGIQGLCSVYADAYMANTPPRIWRTATFRDWVKRDNMRRQQEKFRLRGKWEREAVCLAGHVAGRTDWDRHWTGEWNPRAKYHLLQETLRPCFYEGEWEYAACQKHALFMSQGDYPVKGLHYMLEAMRDIVSRFPDAHLYVAGNCLLRSGAMARLRISGYGKYLEGQIRKNGLAAHITFLGSLDAGQMKEQYLRCNAYVCASSIENSPNSLGEAMLLGVPVVAGVTGGIGSMIARDEGWLFPGFSKEGEGELQRVSRELREQVLAAFAQQGQAAQRTQKARVHARRTHDPARNLAQLLALYRELAAGQESAGME